MTPATGTQTIPVRGALRHRGLRTSVYLGLVLFAAHAFPEWYSEEQPIMGTRVQAEIWWDNADQAQALLDGVMAEMHRIDAKYSSYKDTSELSRLNREAVNGWTSVSAELFDLLQKSLHMSRLTGGAFDITYASVGRFYDYRKGAAPLNSKIAATLAAIDYRHVELDPEGLRVRFAHPAVYVDLGGIAKGYAVDRAIDGLSAAGVTQASVSAGGDSRILGDRGGHPWTVGVRHPRDPERMSAVLPLQDVAVSTSGDYERFFEKDGVRYHHILDPATGTSARGSVSVTILGPDATFTDALSTSVFVLGPEKGLALVNRLPGIDAIVIDAAGKLRYSDELAQLASPPAPSDEPAAGSSAATKGAPPQPH